MTGSYKGSKKGTQQTRKPGTFAKTKKPGFLYIIN